MRIARVGMRMNVGWRMALARVAGPLVLAATTPPARDEPRWRGDFETGDLSQWSYLLNARGRSVVAAPVADGRHACPVEIQKVRP